MMTHEPKISKLVNETEMADHLTETPDSDTFLMRLRTVIGSESVASFARRSGVGESLLRKYLNGSQPSASNALLLADAGGCTIDWLLAGRHPRMISATHLDPSEENALAGDEFLLLKTFRNADFEQRSAITVLLEAIANQGGLAWYRAGEAIGRLHGRNN